MSWILGVETNDCYFLPRVVSYCVCEVFVKPGNSSLKLSVYRTYCVRSVVGILGPKNLSMFILICSASGPTKSLENPFLLQNRVEISVGSSVAVTMICSSCYEPKSIDTVSCL